MNVLIIEDEHYAAKRLEVLLKEVMPEAEILAVLDSVEDSKNWFFSHNEPDLVFMDIQLADGLSFSIFEEVKFIAPVIFVTAFDEYAIEAFKLNSIDYLLKPIEKEKLALAVHKFFKLQKTAIPSNIDWSALGKSLYAQKESYKKRFLIKQGKAYEYLNTSDISLIYAEDGLSFALNKEGQRFIIDHTLDNLESQLDPEMFFRSSRKHLLVVSEIKKIHPYLNSRLKVELKQNISQELVVSREKVKTFKHWLDG